MVKVGIMLELERFEQVHMFRILPINLNCVVFIGQLTIFGAFKWSLCECFGVCRLELHDG